MEISPQLSEGNAIITNIRDLFFSFHLFKQTLTYFYTTINIHSYHEDIKIGNRSQNSNVTFLLQCFEFGIYWVKLVAKPDKISLDMKRGLCKFDKLLLVKSFIKLQMDYSMSITVT